MKKNINFKAFTLVELIAVLAILGIIVVITVPIIDDTINESRKSAFKSSASGIVQSAMQYYLNSKLDGEAFDGAKFTVNGEQMFDSLINDELSFNGKSPIGDSYVEIRKDGEIEMEITDGEYCAVKNFNSSKVIISEDDCSSSNLDEDDSFDVGSYVWRIDPNGGLWGINEDSLSTETQIIEMAINDFLQYLPVPLKESCTFLGWDIDLVGDNDSNILYINFTARWLQNSHRFIVDADGGNISNLEAIPTELGADEIYLLSDIQILKTGYEVINWEVVSGQGSSINSNVFTMGTSATVIKPVWSIIDYEITYELNGGSAVNYESYNIETETFTLNNPTRSGYTFNGWTGSNGSTASTSVSIAKGSTGDKTYTANWTANTYTITYDCNGGSGSTAMSTHTYGVAKALTSNGCYKITAGTSGAVYQFMGWSTSSSATSATYTNGQSVTNLAKTGNVNLYAVWESIFTYSGTKNVISEGSGNWRVEFKGNGTLTINVASTYQFFAVGGGGSGGANRTGTDYRYNGAGGGGGGYTTVKSETFSTVGSTYTVTIGAGGAAVTACCSATATNGNDGGTTKMVSNSSGSTIISAAGGKGGSSSAYGGGAGGAGTGAGGKGGSQTTSVGTAGTGPKGKNGAAAFTTTSVTTTTSGVTYYGAGGGGGGAYYNSTQYAGAAGGTTGGGNGGGYAHLDATHSTITAGTANTGAGGGGTGGGANKLTSAAGGSGILMMRNPR